MDILFYVSSAVALAAAFMAITRKYAFHALLYLVVSLLATALVFFSLNAPLVAVLEIIIYAGAVMVLFIFVVMMLNLGEAAARMEGSFLHPAGWVGPVLLALLLLAEMVYVLTLSGQGLVRGTGASPKEVALCLFGPYVIAVELASFLLLAGLVGAFYLGVRARTQGGEG